MRLPWFAVLLLFGVVLIQGCRTQLPSPTITTEALTPAVSVVNKDIYRIKPGDKILIRNLNWASSLFPDPSQAGTTQAVSDGFEANVAKNGQIVMPEIGTLKAEGLTRQELADTLSVLYKDILLKPIFEVDITNLQVKVLGSVRTQGLLTLDKEYFTLGEIIARSGGILYTEAGGTIQIIRGEGTEQQTIEYDFQQLGNPLIMSQKVYDNDLVYVPPSRASIRNVRFQRGLVLTQPVIIALNLTLIILNYFR